MVLTSARDIRADVEARIASGELRPGQRLPSVRELAGQLGVATATVSAAYQELRRRGRVTGRGRQGTRVAPIRTIESILSAEVPTGLIDAMNGSPAVSYLPDLGQAFAYAASRPQPDYGTVLAEESLAAIGRERFVADGIDATHFTVTSGAMDAIARVITALDLRIGDRIGVEDPGHIPVHQIARRNGLQLVPLAVDEYGITPESLERAIDAAGLSALIVTPRAQNPTGAAFSADRAVELTSILAAHSHIAVIQDDHAGLIAGVDHHGILPSGPRWATMRSLGKSLGPDMRVALVVGDAQTIEQVTADLANGPGWVSFMLQRAAAFLLSDDATAELLRNAAVEYQRRRGRLIGALAAHDIVSSGRSGLNVWLPTSLADASIERARSAGYALRSGDPYRITSPSAVRITTSNLGDADIDAIADAIAAAHRRSNAAPSM